MSFVANVVKVMIASPGDVAEERQAIRDLISEWNYINAEHRGLVLLPVSWETHSTPTMGERPQAIINKQVLSNCDLLVAVFWTRLGSPTGRAASGTVEEIEEHLKAGKPAMLYFSSAPVRLESVDQKQYKSLSTFKAECYKHSLVDTYASLTEFKDKFSRQLAQKIIHEFGTLQAAEGNGGLASDFSSQQQPLVSDLLTDDDAKELLLAAATDGRIIQVRHSGGTQIEAGGRSFITQQTPQEVAKWRSALQKLKTRNLIEAIGTEDQVFDVTHLGYQVAKELADLRKSGESTPK